MKAMRRLLEGRMGSGLLSDPSAGCSRVLGKDTAILQSVLEALVPLRPSLSSAQVNCPVSTDLFSGTHSHASQSHAGLCFS